MSAKLQCLAQRLWYSIGRRGAVLLFLGLLDILFGYSFITSPVTFANAADFLLPYYTWGWIWIGVGIALLIAAFWKNDRLAFGLAAMLKTGWSLANAYVWVHQDIPRIWVSVVIWIAFAGLVLVISSWPESPAIQHKRRFAREEA